MKYIKYNLKWAESVGEQPYVKVAEAGAELEGGQLVDGLDYYGYMYGTDEQCLNAIQAAFTDFNMTEITDAQYIEVYKKIIPIGTEMEDPRTMEIYIVEDIVKEENGKIQMKLVKKEIPSP